MRTSRPIRTGPSGTTRPRASNVRSLSPRAAKIIAFGLSGGPASAYAPPSACAPGSKRWPFQRDNDIDMQGTAGNVLAILVFAVGKSPDQEVDLYVSANNTKNVTERPINIYSVGGRAHIERNVITTGAIGMNVMPSGDVIHIVGPGSFLIAHNSIDCAWATGLQSGIRLQSRPDQAVSDAVVVGNEINMSAPEGTVFGVTSAAIEVRDGGQGNMVLNDRIRGRANFALSVAAQIGVPQSTMFIMKEHVSLRRREAPQVDKVLSRTTESARLSSRLLNPRQSPIL